MRPSAIMYSLIIPVYNNAASLTSLLESLNQLSSSLRRQLEVIFVIDGSPDASLKILLDNKSMYHGWIKIIELTKNFGSLTALKAGIDNARGKYIVTKAADLQEPIGLTIKMFRVLHLRQADIVFGLRQSRNDPKFSTLFSNLFWRLYRHTIEPSIPPGGVDVIGFNEKVSPLIRAMNEHHSSLIEYLFWLGFPKQFIPYHRQKRQHGHSAWTITKKINYVIDSFFAFTDLPIVLLFLLGSSSFIIAFLLALIVIVAKMVGNITVPGYTAIITVSLFFFGLNAIGLSIIGNYVWRTYENTKSRPTYVIKSIYE